MCDQSIQSAEGEWKRIENRGYLKISVKFNFKRDQAKKKGRELNKFSFQRDQANKKGKRMSRKRLWII